MRLFFKRKLLIQSVFLIVGTTLIGLLTKLSFDIASVQSFSTYFNQPRSQLYQTAYSSTIQIPLWKNMKILQLSDKNFIVLDLGVVSAPICHRLLKTDIFFPHQFWIENQKVDSQSNHLCGITSKHMFFQFHKNLTPFAHLLTADSPCHCDKSFSAFGLCTQTCTHHKNCIKPPICLHPKEKRHSYQNN